MLNCFTLWDSVFSSIKWALHVESRDTLCVISPDVDEKTRPRWLLTTTQWWCQASPARWIKCPPIFFLKVARGNLTHPHKTRRPPSLLGISSSAPLSLLPTPSTMKLPGARRPQKVRSAAASAPSGTDSEASLSSPFLRAACARWGCVGDHSYQIQTLHRANSSQSPHGSGQVLAGLAPELSHFPAPRPPPCPNTHTPSPPEMLVPQNMSLSASASGVFQFQQGPSPHTVHHKGALVCASRAASGCFHSHTPLGSRQRWGEVRPPKLLCLA